LDNTARVDAIVKADQHVHLKVISKELGILYGSVYDIVHDSLGYRKVSCRWVPKLLDDLNKAKRMMTSLQHLQRYSEERESGSACAPEGHFQGAWHFVWQCLRYRSRFLGVSQGFSSEDRLGGIFSYIAR
jgi:hypothetical protein